MYTHANNTITHFLSLTAHLPVFFFLTTVSAISSVDTRPQNVKKKKKKNERSVLEIIQSEVNV